MLVKGQNLQFDCKIHLSYFHAFGNVQDDGCEVHNAPQANTDHALGNVLRRIRWSGDDSDACFLTADGVGKFVEGLDREIAIHDGDARSDHIGMGVE